ncbi:hypothetical protein PoB_004998800 [Plakobranchus ocellatus]|uniref:Uncharacterized protein n=1 Tax=Plakobranchus ocellatus TaxID=259542 RepID=A0AAV4BV68_9GAST|nr:hypothetical protein PoB_004998800 [Plakobranchus ocellatus]
MHDEAYGRLRELRSTWAKVRAGLRGDYGRIRAISRAHCVRGGRSRPGLYLSVPGFKPEGATCTCTPTRLLPCFRTDFSLPSPGWSLALG